MKRKIYEELLEWKNLGCQKPLMVIGARQIGKTYIINEFCTNEFQKYIYINLLEKPEIVEIFSRKISMDEKYQRMKLVLNVDIDIENTIIFFDEIQESEELISSLKYFCESEKPYKIVCAGSLLGVKLKRFHASFPVGKVKIITMFSMDFEEFLLATQNEGLRNEIQRCYNELCPMEEVLHEKLLNLYREYLCIGGMPEAVKNFSENEQDLLKFDSSITENIITSYLNDMNKYIQSKNESIKIESIYKSIPVQLGNASNKFQFGKIAQSARRRDYETALDWLLSSTMAFKCVNLRKIEIPPMGFADFEHFKLYLSDVGLLTNLLGAKFTDIFLDTISLYKGRIAENYVATQLLANKHTLFYWESGNTAEVDFVLYTDDGLIPIEVKANDNVMSKSLTVYTNRYNPKYAIRISTKNFGNSNNIKSIPLYATFCIK